MKTPVRRLQEQAYLAIIIAAYENDPVGWDEDDMFARAERLRAFMRTQKGQRLLHRLSKAGFTLRMSG
jgi:hypothetical protein